MAVEDFGELDLELSDARDVDCFEKIGQIGEGRHGRVFLARERTGKIITLKKFPKTAIRGIEILKTLQHDNVIKLLEIVTLEGDDKENETCMVLEYMDHDLKGLITSYWQDFAAPLIKCYMRQLLTGLQYCHEKQVLHRDITSSNILINHEGNLKLANFGLARLFSDEKEEDPATSLVCRAPELLLGATEYSSSIDMWSVGCVFAELLTRKPYFTGMTEEQQLRNIFTICGAPEKCWPEVSVLPRYQKYKDEKVWDSRWLRYDANAVDLLDKMFTLDPSKRISVEDALRHAYFQAEPETSPYDPKRLLKYESTLKFQIMMKQPSVENCTGVGNQSRVSITSETYDYDKQFPSLQKSAHARMRPQLRDKINQPLENPGRPPLITGEPHHQDGNPVGVPRR